MKKHGIKIVNSLYKHEAPCSELAFLVVKEFMKVTATKNKCWSETELRQKVDKVIMAYFQKSNPNESRR